MSYTELISFRCEIGCLTKLERYSNVRSRAINFALEFFTQNVNSSQWWSYCRASYDKRRRAWAAFWEIIRED